jgi:NAD-dependent dihydropyrimidine dehydrogenase PreA subunit
MPTSVIIGSGPAAAGAAMALLRDPNQQIVILDVGGELEEEQQQIRRSIASLPEAEWMDNGVQSISRQPAAPARGALPEKRAFGSDFPFRDFGQLAGVRAVDEANRSVVSGAYGGFSNVWGAQIMPFSAATFDRWPIDSAEMESHYRVALTEMTLTGEVDDLSVLFPLLISARPLPKLNDRTERVLNRYGSHRAKVQSLGITLGRARLAMRSESCTLCGLCMTGCPYQLIYSASQTFDRLRADSRVTYRKGVLALSLGETDSVPYVDVRDRSGSGQVERVTADRIFVACGGIGTTRLVLGSIQYFDRPVRLKESVQFVMPVISKARTSDPRRERDFTLNQFNLIYDASGDGVDLCQIHFYPYNPAMESSVPGFLKGDVASPLVTSLFRRLTVGLGYLPSWASPEVKVTARSGFHDLPELVIDRDPIFGWPELLRKLTAALVRAAPALDLWPILPMVSVSGAAKSYHFGGSFPHSFERSEMKTDRMGRLERWNNIHLVDASVFPDVPATTFTLTVMANAHRVASETLANNG